MQHNVVVRFLIALYYLLFSRTELLCYTMMILDHMSNASVLSLPLPFFAFFWGTLCSPRPPKFFWITVITYTEVSWNRGSIDLKQCATKYKLFVSGNDCYKVHFSIRIFSD